MSVNRIGSQIRVPALRMVESQKDTKSLSLIVLLPKHVAPVAIHRGIKRQRASGG